MGLLYELARGVDRNLETAEAWYRRGAAQGHAPSQYKLGWMYRKGISVDQDDKAAVMWYQRSAERGYLEAMWNLAVMYNIGKGINKDRNYAYMWASLASARGSKYGTEVTHHLTKLMSKAEVVAAKKLAQSCLSRKYKEC